MIYKMLQSILNYHIIPILCFLHKSHSWQSPENPGSSVASFIKEGNVKLGPSKQLGTLSFWGKDEFTASFQLFVRKYKPGRDIISIISADNEQIVRLVTLPYRKLEFSLILDNHVVKITTPKIKIGRWNKCQVKQRKSGLQVLRTLVYHSSYFILAYS